MLEQSSSQQRTLLEQSTSQLRNQAIIGRVLSGIVRNSLDCWTPSKRSRDEDRAFKERLITHYECAPIGSAGGARASSASSAGEDEKKVRCMLVNDYFSSAEVRGSHIWKRATHGKGLAMFGLAERDVHSERNGLLLCVAIEQAFDTKRLCFLYDPLARRTVLRVLDPDLLDKQVYPSSQRFRDIDGRALVFNRSSSTVTNPPRCPFRRLLHWHAKLSVDHALSMGWLATDDVDDIDTRFELSEGALFPDDELRSIAEEGAADGEGDAEGEDAVDESETAGIGDSSAAAASGSGDHTLCVDCRRKKASTKCSHHKCGACCSHKGKHRHSRVH